MDPPPATPVPPPSSQDPIETLFARYFEKKDFSASDLSDALQKIGAEAIKPAVDKARSHAQDTDFAGGILTFIDKTPSPDRLTGLTVLAREPFPNEVRTEAIEILGRAGDVESARLLVQLLKDDKKGDVAPSVGRALESLSQKPGRAAAAAAALELEPILRDDRAEAIRPIAIGAYVALADPPDAGLLRDLARTGNDVHTRVAALFALGRTGGRASTSIILSALTSNLPPVQIAALFAAGQTRSWELVPEMIDLLENGRDDRDFKTHVANALSKITNQTLGLDPESWKIWWNSNGKKLLDDGGELTQKLAGDAEARIQALQFIGSNRCDLWLDEVLRLISWGDVAVRIEAVRTVGHIRSPRGVPALLQALSVREGGLREQAASSLEQILGVFLGLDEEPWTLWWDALPERNGGKTDALIRLMTAEDSRVRLSAIRKLGEHLTPDAGPGLIQALEDADPLIASEACQTLGKLRYQRAVGPMIEVLLKENASINSRAISALRDITGQSFTTYDDWSEWWKATPH